jgi:hypothetical protein
MEQLLAHLYLNRECAMFLESRSLYLYTPQVFDAHDEDMTALRTLATATGPLPTRAMHDSEYILFAYPQAR